ncbi:reverse transcriptase [Biomphalaria glabrata]
MRKLLDPIESPGIQNFIDDILIATETWSEHIALISSLLLRLRETGLTARPSKCLIGFTRLKFLGHVIQENQLMPDEEKVAQLLEAPRPITKTGVRSFLGMCGYYQKFIPHFNSIAAPLSDLTKKDRPDKVTWNEECELAFQRLKECLTSSPVLKLPDLSRTFVLRTDASGSGLGAVLMQTAEGSGDTLFPVAYASRKLNQAESNYATIELECLALVWAIEKFQAFLYGKHFTLQTDHKPLSYLSSSKHLNARLMRWSLLLQPYSFQVEHVPGCQNAAPDFLSRHCVLEPTGLNGYHPSVNLNN